MATKKPKGLGRGLEALLGPKVDDKAAQAEAVQTGQPSTLNLDQMVAGQYQPRTRMDEGALYELAESIKAQGIMQPILVRLLGQGANAGKYEIIAGERRFRASRLAGLDSVPVLVRDVPDEAAAAMALPRGSAVVYRSFGAADAEDVARKLVKIARRRGLKLLIGADHRLAARIGAHGVHLPERLSGRAAAICAMTSGLFGSSGIIVGMS